MPVHLNGTIALLLLVAGGCSSGGSDDRAAAPGEGSPYPEGSTAPDTEFVDRWTLTGYTLDDGTVKSVPGDIRAEGEVGIVVSANGTIAVRHDLCDHYDVSYRLDNGVLTTANPVDPDTVCLGMYADTDNAESSELLKRSLSGTQTLVEVSDDTLEVTTERNEVLVFERLAEPPGAPVPFEEMRRGDLVAVGNRTFPQPPLRVLRDRESLDSLYDGLPPCAGPCEPIPLPPVDFDTSIVVFVAHDIESTGGFDIRVTDAYLTEGSGGVAVNVLHSEPGEGCDVDQGFSGPFAFYRLETRVERVAFHERTEVGPAC